MRPLSIACGGRLGERQCHRLAGHDGPHVDAAAWARWSDDGDAAALVELGQPQLREVLADLIGDAADGSALPLRDPAPFVVEAILVDFRVAADLAGRAA